MNYLIFFSLMIGIYLVPDIIETLHTTFSRDSNIAYSHLHFFKNFQTEVQVQERSLTYSLKRRYLEFTGEQSDSTANALKNKYESNMELRNSPHYQEQVNYLDRQVNKISRTFLYTRDRTFRMLSLMNDYSRTHLSTTISLSKLREPRIYGDFSNLNYNVDSIWESCFISRIGGMIDFVVLEPDYQILAVAYSNYRSFENINKIRFYPHLECVTAEENSNLNNQNFDSGYTKGKSPWYQEISLAANYGKVQIMDAIPNFIVYGLFQDNSYLHMTYKNEKGEWEHNSFQFPESYNSFPIHQTLGVKIVQDGEYDEKQIVVTELVGTDKELLLMGKLYKIQDNQSEKTHVKRAQRYRLNEGESSQYYDKRYTLSETMSLFTINVTDEIKSLDNFSKFPFPPSKFVFDVKKHQLVVLSLDKYVVMLQFLNNTNSFRTTKLENIEQEVDYIDRIVASEDSSFYGFLAHYKSSTKVYVLYNEFHEDEQLHELYVTKIELQQLPKLDKIKDFRIEKDTNDVPLLIVLYEGGEIAGLALEFVKFSFESSIAFVFKEGLEIFFTIILISFVTLLVSCFRRAPSIRININAFE